MTVSSGKNTSKKRKKPTKLAPGSWLDNMPEPFQTAASVDALFKNVELREKELAKEKASKK